MTREETIAEITRRLVESCNPLRIYLFGSAARGDEGPDSDLDFLIVEPVVHARRSEMVRLRSVLAPLGVPADVLVVSRAVFDAWKDQINNVVNTAAKEGRVYAAA